MQQTSTHAESEGAEPVRVTIPVPRMASRASGIASLVGIAAIATYVSGAFPSFAVRIALPLAALFATIAVRAVCLRSSPTLCTFDARGIRFEATGLDRRTPWSHVTRIATTKAALVIEGLSGALAHLPWSSNPDVRGILALAPKSVEYQSRDLGASRGRARLTFVLWIILIVVMMAIYSLLAQDPAP